MNVVLRVVCGVWCGVCGVGGCVVWVCGVTGEMCVRWGEVG